MKKILVTGCRGQVGWELQRTLATLGKVIPIDQEQLDLSNPSLIIRALREIRPDIVVNAAAYTAVDKAESDKEMAMAINAKAPAVLAEEVKKLNGIFIHYSTDYVYDGSLPCFHEESATSPLNIYGESKLIGDLSVEAIGGNFCIFRTSWVYGARGKNFLLTMLQLAKTKEILNIVDDQFGSPTWSRLLAEATAQALNSYKGQKGVFHLTCAGKTNWSEFAEKIFKECAHHPQFKAPIVRGIPSSEYLLPAKRPQNSILSNVKIQEAFGIFLPDWHHALKLCIDELLSIKY